MINKKSILILSLFFSLAINKLNFAPAPRVFSQMFQSWAREDLANKKSKPTINAKNLNPEKDKDKTPISTGITTREAWFLLNLNF